MMKKTTGIILTSIVGLAVLASVAYSRMSSCRGEIVSAFEEIDVATWNVTPLAPLRAYTKIQLAASPEAVFHYLSDEQTLPEWMPGLSRLSYDHSASVVVGALAPGSRRNMLFGEQPELEEIVQLQQPNLIAYRILEGVPVQNHLAIMVIEKNANNGSNFTWYQAFDIQQSSAMGVMMPFMVRRFLQEAEINLIQKFGGKAVEAC